MAILSKIRERSLFLIFVIGLPLSAFILAPSTLTDFFNSRKINEVGYVNGNPVSRQEFAEALDSYKVQVGNRVSDMQAVKNVWENLVRRKIYDTQLAEAGITIGEADILNSLYEQEFIKNDSRFQTTNIFNKDKFKEFLATIKAENGDEWKAWRDYMNNQKANLQKSTYDNLVAAGLGASLEEGKAEYFNENTKINADLVYLPYTMLADSLVKVTKSEVKSYMKKHVSEFEVEASRDISFVKFDVKATPEDENDIKKEVENLINDSDKGKGLKSVTDYITFLEDTKSDLLLNENAQFKSQVPQAIADSLFNGNPGDVFGPYKDIDYYKLSKIIEISEIPDSVKSSHILIPFSGGLRANASVNKTEKEAKKTADSIYSLVRNNKTRFKKIADEINTDATKGKGGDIGWTSYNVGFSDQFDRDFANFIFNNKKGAVEVVKTKFGYHIIRVDEQKNKQKAIKLATFARKIEASEATENAIFQDSETFAQQISKGKIIDEIAKEKKLVVSPAVGLKMLDENIPALGNERQIISWAFGKDTNAGDFKRFDVDGGYVIAVLKEKTQKGLMSADKAIAKVSPVLSSRKKAEILKEKMENATSLDDIATATKKTIKKINEINLKSPTISGIGFEPKVVGAMLNAKENEVYKNIVGDRGIYAFKVTGKVLPAELPNYDTYRKRIANQRKNQVYNMYQAVKKVSKIQNEVGGSFYGIGQ